MYVHCTYSYLIYMHKKMRNKETEIMKLVFK